MKARISIAVISIICLFTLKIHAETIVEWDFTKGTGGWVGNHKVEPVRINNDGLVVVSTGEDPWIEGPAVDIPAGKITKVIITMKSDADSSAQVFYGRHFEAGKMCNMHVFNDGMMHQYHVMIIEDLGPGTRFRLDPCNNEGNIVVQSIKVEVIDRPVPPVFKEPGPFDRSAGAVKISSGGLALAHSKSLASQFGIYYDGTLMATGYDKDVIAYDKGGQVEYLELDEFKTNVIRTGSMIVSTGEMKDADGVLWKIERSYKIETDGRISVQSSVVVSKDRQVLLFPWLTVLAGHGSFGQSKDQGVFAGLEYLSDEPSSSEADISAPKNDRRLPDPVMITFPLMAIENDGKHVGVIWEKSDLVAAGFDSPDRIFNSGGHAMFLTGPAVGQRRFANTLIGQEPFKLSAGQKAVSRSWIIAGKSDSIIGAVKQYIDLKGFPDLPVYEGGLEKAAKLLADGWLDSKINVDWRFRHAVWNDNFKPTPAADAAAFMTLLGEFTDDTKLKSRLKDGTEKALSKLNSNDPYASSVSHVRPPIAPLLFGRIDEYLQARKAQSYRQVNGFAPDGRVIYRPGDKGDFGRTHFADHANGISGNVVADILETAALINDSYLIENGLRLLDKQTKLYENTVPRGAQTWEMPLHTPDILASAHMVRAYTYGYVLSGKTEYLEQAKYWAWTGVPLLYLENPTDGTVGPYAVIAVLGATNWQAPVWFGQPVQWCGLVYCSSLHLLSEYDPDGPWKKIAMGITLTGMQMTWTQEDAERQGLLPDFFHLKAQVSDGPAINPGTVGAHLLEAFDKGKIYDFKKADNGMIVHGPCKINFVQHNPGSFSASFQGIKSLPYYILISGVYKKPDTVKSYPDRILESSYNDQLKVLTVRLSGPSSIWFECN